MLIPLQKYNERGLLYSVYPIRSLVPCCREAAIRNKNFLGTDPIRGLRNSFPQTAPREAPQRLDPTPVLLKNEVFQQLKQEFGPRAAEATHVSFFAVESML
jgi:hypothetical protein